MRQSLLFLAISLTLLYMIGGSEALTNALTNMFVLASVQVIRHFLDSRNQVPQQRLRKRTDGDFKSRS